MTRFALPLFGYISSLFVSEVGVKSVYEGDIWKTVAIVAGINAFFLPVLVKSISQFQKLKDETADLRSELAELKAQLKNLYCVQHKGCRLEPDESD